MSPALYLAGTSGLFRLTDDRHFLTVAAVTGQPVRLVTDTS
jgi:hypothetical protein